MLFRSHTVTIPSEVLKHVSAGLNFQDTPSPVPTLSFSASSSASVHMPVLYLWETSITLLIPLKLERSYNQARHSADLRQLEHLDLLEYL